jgi:hypothetical protein
VWVDDPNPLLFTYKFGGITQVKNTDVVALEAMSTELQKAAKILSPDTEVGATAHAESINKFSTKVFLSPQATSDLTAVTTDLGNAIQQLVNQQKAVPCLTEKSADASNWFPMEGRADVDGDCPTGSDGVKLTVKNWNMGELTKRISDDYKEIDNVVKPFLLTVPEPSVQAALNVRADVLVLLKALNDFASTVARIGVPVAITKADGSRVFIDFDILNDQKFVVNIASLDRDKGFSQAAEDKLTDEKIPLKEDLTIVAVPHHNVHLRTAMAAVYNFVRRPTFDANKSGDDLVIRRKDADRWTGQNVGLMLHIVPANWDQQFLSGEFQFGITPIANQFAAYLGGGVVFNKYFSLATGIVAQRVDRLATGLHVGDVVASADDVKTVKRFQMGAYICLTVDFKMPTGK